MPFLNQRNGGQTDDGRTTDNRPLHKLTSSKAPGQLKTNQTPVLLVTDLSED